jgi:hypothetical protein
MQDLLEEDNVSNDNEDVQQFNVGTNQGTNAETPINLNDLSHSSTPNNLQPPPFIDLGDFSNYTTPMRGNKHPTKTTMITLGNIKVKRKKTLVFMLIIKATNKHNKVIVNAMDWSKNIQLDINKMLTG